MSVEYHVITGFVGGTPETREVGDPEDLQTVTTMSVAVNARQKEAPPIWYRVTMWGGLGQVVQEYVDKGHYVVIVGNRLRPNIWYGQSGAARVSLELTATAVDFSANRKIAEDADGDIPDPDDTDEIPF